jgi:RNA recognition motif-containing protein
MSRERTKSPSIAAKDADMEVDSHSPTDTKVIVITNLTRNVVESHLKTIFGFYGRITKIDLPVFGKCAYSSTIT